MLDGLIDELLDREGGYVNHPADRGGPTNYGITQAVAPAHGYGGAMRDLPRHEAAAIYTQFAEARPRSGGGAIAKSRGGFVRHGSQHGPEIAATSLQRALTTLNRDGAEFRT